MKRTIKISINDFESIEDSTVINTFKNHENKLATITEDLYLQYKDYLSKRDITEQFTFEVDQSVVDIFNYIHIIRLESAIKNLSPLERFLLTIYVVNTYGDSEAKETEELIHNITELEFEIDSILVKEEDSYNLKQINPLLDQIIKISNPINGTKIIEFKDIYLTFEDQIVPELSKENAIIQLRETKLNQLLTK